MKWAHTFPRLYYASAHISQKHANIKTSKQIQEIFRVFSHQKADIFSIFLDFKTLNLRQNVYILAYLSLALLWNPFLSYDINLTLAEIIIWDRTDISWVFEDVLEIFPNVPEIISNLTGLNRKCKNTKQKLGISNKIIKIYP